MDKKLNRFATSMTGHRQSKTIAILAPEIPALSATFVYEELYALERAGYKVCPVSVHLPKTRALGHDGLADRTYYLYRTSKVAHLGVCLAAVFKPRRRMRAAFSALLKDMWETGFLSSQSLKLCYQFLVATSLADHMEKLDCEHLHIHFAHVPAQIGMYACLLLDIPFTITGHANDLFERSLLLPEKARRAKKFLTISYYNRQRLIDAGLPSEKLEVVRCGVSFATKERTHTRNDPPRIGSLGRMVEKKGFDTLIEAIGRLCDGGCEVILELQGDGPLRPNLEDLVKSLKLDARVQMPGPLAHQDVANWLSKLDLFVLPSKIDNKGDMDGIPVVLMEAMSQQVPVISTRLSGIPELVMHEETGLLAEPDDPDDLADKIKRLLEDPQSMEIYSKAGARHVEAEFSQKVNVARIEAIMQVKED